MNTHRPQPTCALSVVVYRLPEPLESNGASSVKREQRCITRYITRSMLKIQQEKFAFFFIIMPLIDELINWTKLISSIY